MESTITPSFKLNKAVVNGSPDWSYLLKNGNDLHQTVITIYDVSKDLFVFVSQSATKILGYEPDHFSRFKAMDWISMIHCGEQSLMSEILRNNTSQMNGKNTSFQYRLRHQKGHWVYVNHEQNFLEYETGLWVVNLIIDITEKERFNHHLYKIKCGGQRYINNDLPANKHLNRLGVSERELEVIRLIGSGFSSKEIADKLFISSHTAITHRKNLIKKFKVRNTAQLIKEAARRMLLN
ncbi:LuxR C-terminal-related transcriptional regulator [Fulvivirgaceae bacterium BMA12]|uniref:LuxR C-terminal-related transcriptional regulator n=1 Tax=Agaribacillus aureus TaxID=3051825 RepID=A0ABT8L4Q8_9BACT|nr:LuxR C-terminal-related transcriptional regulator [Fulvivirgaceae bacterium BMA12]